MLSTTVQTISEEDNRYISETIMRLDIVMDAFEGTTKVSTTSSFACIDATFILGICPSL